MNFSSEIISFYMQFEDGLFAESHDDSVAKSELEKLQVCVLKLPFFFAFIFITGLFYFLLESCF